MDGHRRFCGQSGHKLRVSFGSCLLASDSRVVNTFHFSIKTVYVCVGSLLTISNAKSHRKDTTSGGSADIGRKFFRSISPVALSRVIILFTYRQKQRKLEKDQIQTQMDEHRRFRGQSGHKKTVASLKSYKVVDH